MSTPACSPSGAKFFMTMSAVHCSGALRVLLAFFEHSRQLACDACIMISTLLDNEGFTYAHVRNTASLLIQLPAIHCFSTLLEPLDADELPGNTYRTCKAPAVCVGALHSPDVLLQST